ncbi:hypothetical protein ALP29_201677 [Pseudomonas syringae pv. avii]|uniref:Uncharacterized protein n=1 Tax=Pseudomonas syringae pv. avii TaxID=663959 RepID=A0A3M5UXP3_PSESX|nr:hypothetical protein ALP29_201677 [Pseudomonas syringae pv. avii]
MLVNAALYHLGWHLERVEFDTGLNLHGDELPRPKLFAGVFEPGLGADCAGGCRHLIVDQRQRAFTQQQAIGCPIALIGFDGSSAVRGNKPLQCRQHLLWQGKLDGNRVDLRDRK